MIPAQLDHLRRIDAHLANLLATAEKRTPGEWTTRSNTEHIDYGEPIRVESNKPPFSVAYHGSENCFLSAGDAAFIAACAGNAEAGWRATRAAIAAAMQLQGISLSPCNGGSCMVATDAEDSLEGAVNAFVQSILAAFPNV